MGGGKRSRSNQFDVDKKYKKNGQKQKNGGHLKSPKESHKRNRSHSFHGISKENKKKMDENKESENRLRSILNENKKNAKMRSKNKKETEGSKPRKSYRKKPPKKKKNKDDEYVEFQSLASLFGPISPKSSKKIKKRKSAKIIINTNDALPPLKDRNSGSSSSTKSPSISSPSISSPYKSPRSKTPIGYHQNVSTISPRKHRHFSNVISPENKGSFKRPNSKKKVHHKSIADISRKN